MKTSRIRKAFSAVAILAASLVAIAAQQPKVEHAQISVQSGGDLQGAIAGTLNPTWIGYSEATAHAMNNSWDDGVQYLEGRPSASEVTVHGAVGSSDTSSMVILLRVLGGRVSKVNIADPARTLDAGGLPFVWINGVSQPASLKVLTVVAEQGIVATPAAASADNARSSAIGRSTTERALVAIAMHSDPAATAALQSFTAERAPSWARERAAFWLANERGPQGFEAVKAMLHSEHDDDVRAKLVFDLTLVKGDSRQAAVEQLIALARNDASPKVRKQAQFWLAQQVSRGRAGDSRIEDTLRQQASNDPDSAIRKSAVFALSRLPQEQATDELIRVASTTTDPTTRREAVFWLGQSQDHRALDYLEKLAKQ